MLPVEIKSTVSTSVAFTGPGFYPAPLGAVGQAGTTGATGAPSNSYVYGPYLASGVAWKSSTLPIIYTMSVTSNGGATLINETPGAAAYINGLRALYDVDMEYSSEQSLIDFFGKDVNSGGSMFYGSVVKGQPQPNLNTVNLNPTFLNRCAMFYMKSSGASGVSYLGASNYAAVPNPCYYNCFLKLSLLHDAFKQLNRPVQNFPLIFTFTISGAGAGSQFMPIAVADCSSAHISTGNPVVPVTTVIAAAGVSVINGFQLPQSRLLLKIVTLSKADLENYNRMCEEGAEQQIEYLVTDIVTGSGHTATIGAAGAVQVANDQITSNTIMPFRIRVLSYPLLQTIPQEPSANASLFPGGWHNSAVNWTAVNLIINGAQFYQNDLASSMEIYDLIKSEQPYGVRSIQQGGSQLGYDAFINGVTDLCFPLKRYQQANVNNICSISFRGNAATNMGTAGGSSQLGVASPITSGTMQMVYLIERVVTLKMKYTKSGLITQIVQGRDLEGVTL